MLVLLVSSIAVAFWYEALANDHSWRPYLEWADMALVVFFVVEWLWRVRSNPDGPGKYAVRNSWELLGMVPLLLPLPAFLRALRFLRVVRILRMFSVVGSTLGFFDKVSKRGGLKKVGLAAGAITVGGGALVWALERGEPGTSFTSFGESLWWAVVTVTTVGYGDVTPQTVMGRFVAAILMVLGIGIFGVLAAAMASVMFDDDEEEDASHDLPSTLERLAALHGAGSLTDEEFVRAKEQVLG